MTEQRAHPEVDTSWAPVGWEPSDIGFDDAPFGTVLGDPLMGSPIFDVSVLDAAGDLRTVQFAGVNGFSFEGNEPIAELGENATATVGTDGTIYAASAAAAR